MWSNIRIRNVENNLHLHSFEQFFAFQIFTRIARDLTPFSFAAMRSSLLFCNASDGGFVRYCHWLFWADVNTKLMQKPLQSKIKNFPKSGCTNGQRSYFTVVFRCKSKQEATLSFGFGSTVINNSDCSHLVRNRHRRSCVALRSRVDHNFRVSSFSRTAFMSRSSRTGAMSSPSSPTMTTTINGCDGGKWWCCDRAAQPGRRRCWCWMPTLTRWWKRVWSTVNSSKIDQCTGAKLIRSVFTNIPCFCRL